MEIFKPITGASRYEISREGTVRIVRSVHGTPMIRVVKINMNSVYPTVNIYGDDRTNPPSRLIHRLLALEFIPGYAPHKLVNHIDGNKKNFALSNLEWITYKENSEHYKMFLKGAGIPQRKERHKLVVECRRIGLTNQQIARAFEITPQWVHVLLKKEFQNTIEDGAP